MAYGRERDKMFICLGCGFKSEKLADYDTHTWMMPRTIHKMKIEWKPLGYMPESNPRGEFAPYGDHVLSYEYSYFGSNKKV